jgi:hypothetical protein
MHGSRTADAATLQEHLDIVRLLLEAADRERAR